MARTKKTGRPRSGRPVVFSCGCLRRANPAGATNGDDTEVIATVELVTRFRHRGLAANRTLFAIADEVEPAGIDAAICQVLSRGSRTALSESQVVLIRATVVRVAFDPDPHAWIGLQPRNLAV